MTQDRLFREYILFRARVVVYFAAALVVFVLVGLGFALWNNAENAYRFGLVLQILGVLALIPDIVGRSRLSFFQKQDPAVELATVEDPTDPPSGSNGADHPAIPVADPPDRFTYYHAHNYAIFWGNALTALVLIILLWADLVDPHPVWLPGELFVSSALALLGFLWINGLLLVVLLRAAQPRQDERVLPWFFTFDMLISVIGFIPAGVLHALTSWVSRALDYVYGAGIRRVLQLVTLPCFLVGLVLELIASF